jgi:hypothetical protein
MCEIKEMIMNTTNYPSPVDKLLTYGKPEPKDAQNWPDYLELGLGPEHIPDLIRMTADNELWEAGQDTSENWAPVHAWRALGQLRAANAVDPLLHLFEERDSDDWAIEELPQVYGLIGAAAIPTIEAYVADQSHEQFAGLAQSGLEYMAKLHLEDKPEAVAAIMRLLENFEENDYELNAFLISSLVDLKVLEALPLIERAFAAHRVDESITGDWDDVQVELGLKEAPPETPPMSFPLLGRRRTPLTPDMFEIVTPDEEQDTPSSVLANPSPSYFSPTSFRERKPSRKAKNKMAKKSRKKNKKRR